MSPSRTPLVLAIALLAALAWTGCGGSGPEGGCTPAAEACNGVDDDCDGAVDEGLGDLTCGQGICAASVPACLAGAPQTCTPGTPDPAEGCDGVDDDCDGTVDEDCDCLDGATQACYSGPAGTPDFGACHAGEQTCAGGAWGTCAGETLPAAETCNLVDEDCDGVVDDGDPGGGATCDTGLDGACGAGVERCEGGEIVCAQLAFPAAEVCNGVDDDCDGAADEGFDVGTGCSAGVGACFAMGATACLPDGSGTACDAQPGDPAPEACNGADDDCDGAADEELVGSACDLQQGVCAGSIQVCNGSFGWECGQESYGPDWEPVETMCDMHDNDCDGATNEGLTLTVFRDDDLDGHGSPSGASQACTLLAGWSLTGDDCDDTRSAVHPGATELCNGSDDDCDAAADEGFGVGATCSAGVGECLRAGAVACVSETSSACTAVPGLPSAELCNGKDDDCDGVTDEGFAVGASCTAGIGACATPGILACRADGTGTECVGTPLPPSAETCNGIDDDCDGSVDEDLPVPLCERQAGVCAGSRKTCGGASGWLACTAANYGPSYEASEATCDGLDNDCDAIVDEGVALVVFRDDDGDGYGVTGTVRTACSVDPGWATVGGDCDDTQAATHPGAPEACGDALDNNCDGRIDEGC